MPLAQAAIDWPTAATIVAVVAPLVAVPLTVVVLHLRTMRDHQTAQHSETSRRLELLDASVGSVRHRLVEIQRDYTTKEEWLRESMAARHHLERLLEAVTRLETEIDVVRGWSRYIESRLASAGGSDTPQRQATAGPGQAEQC